MNVPLLSLENWRDFNALESLLRGVVVGDVVRNKVEWIGDNGGVFTVASCYGFYAYFRTPFGPPNRYDISLEKVWKMDVSFKIKTFRWRLFVNRLSMKDLLKIRGIDFPLNSLNCAFCGVELVGREHTFVCAIFRR